jgi:hypothetical protein
LHIPRGNLPLLFRLFTYWNPSLVLIFYTNGGEIDCGLHKAGIHKYNITGKPNWNCLPLIFVVTRSLIFKTCSWSPTPSSNCPHLRKN